MALRSIKKRKKRSFWDKLPGSKIASQTVKDLEDIAKGTPGGIFEAAKAVSPGANFGDLARGKRPPIFDLFENQVRGVGDVVEHPLRNPGYSLITLLGLAPLPGAAAAKGGAVARSAARKPAKPKKKPPTRNMAYKPKNSEEAEIFRLNMGLESAPTTVQFKVPASRVATTRAAQKGVDKLRSKSDTLQRRKVEKVLSRKKDIISRISAENPPGVMAAAKEAFTTTAPLKKLKEKPVREGVRELNALVRGLRLYRGAYIPPNWLGAQTVNVIGSGPKTYAKNVRAQHRLRKEDPETAQTTDRLMGETSGQAIGDTGGKAAAPGESASGPLGVFMRGVGTTLGKGTDRASRSRALFKEAEDMDYTPKDLRSLYSRAEKGDWKAVEDLTLIVERAENSAMRFTRTPPLKGRKESMLSKTDRALADNIFLYKWLTASTRYGGHMLGEHPTLSMMLAHQGQDAPAITDLIEEVPEFMENYIPRGIQDALPHVNNPTAASLYDFPFEVLNTLGRAKDDFRELTDIFNPVQAAGGNAATGFDPFRDQEISEFKDDPWSRAKFGSATQLRSIPWLEWLRINDSEEEREGKLFPLSPMDILFRQLVGSSLHPTGFPVNPEIAKKMARQEREKGKDKSRKKRRRRPSGDF